MVEYRTATQIEADRIDLEMFRLSMRLGDFAQQCCDDAVVDVSRQLFGARSAIRRHMHKNDRIASDG